MPAKHLLRISKEGTYCHVYNKAIENRLIFNDEQDYNVFLGYLKDYLTPANDPESAKKTFTVNGRAFRGVPHQPKNYYNKVELVAFSLMPDHFHMLVHQTVENSLQSFIRSLCTRYSIYFNKKYQRTGSLFAGPYKSVEIKDNLQLGLLAWYFHQAGNYSSSKEYMGSRETSWVKPTVGSKPTSRYQPTEAEKKLLEEIALEAIDEHLERRKLAATNKSVNQKPKSKYRIPEFLAASGVFLILISLGIRNINAYSAPKTKVLGVTIQISPAPILPSPTPTPLAKTKTTLIVKIDEGSTINIRKEATTESQIVGTAKSGQVFEYLKLDSGWYKVFMDDGTGFISSNYVEPERTTK
jgi:hypothetical protein